MDISLLHFESKPSPIQYSQAQLYPLYPNLIGQPKMNPLADLILDYLFLANLYVLQSRPQDKVKTYYQIIWCYI